MLKTHLVRLFSFILLWSSVLLAGCDKDELTIPATITCKFISQSPSAMGGKLTVNRLDLSIAQTSISGKRTSGEDMFFIRSFNKQTGYFPLLAASAPATVLQVPQGSYNTIIFYTILREEDYVFESGNSEGEDEETSDLNEYVAKARPGLLIVARYANVNMEFPVIVSMNDNVRRFGVEALQNGTSGAVLYKDVPVQATFTLDPEYLFSSITPGAIEAAQKFPFNGEQAVMISAQYNTSLYNQLAGRIPEAVALTLEDQ